MEKYKGTSKIMCRIIEKITKMVSISENVQKVAIIFM
jgi:hypothetical protein